MKLFKLIPALFLVIFTNGQHNFGEFYTIKKTFENSNVDGYNLYVPNDCSESNSKCPTIMFLQGGLGVGNEVDVIFNWELPKELKETKELSTELDSLKLTKFIYVMPHIARGEFYTNENAILEILAKVSEDYNIDTNRMYLTGLSRGGHGTWGLASRLPNVFTAIAPIAGSSHGITNYQNLTKTPILAIHNIHDGVVQYRRTKETVEKIEELSDTKFQRISDISELDYQNDDHVLISGNDEEKGHNAWTIVYNNANFYKWLLRFSKENSDK